MAEAFQCCNGEGEMCFGQEGVGMAVEWVEMDGRDEVHAALFQPGIGIAYPCPSPIFKFSFSTCALPS